MLTLRKVIGEAEACSNCECGIVGLTLDRIKRSDGVINLLARIIWLLTPIALWSFIKVVTNSGLERYIQILLFEILDANRMCLGLTSIPKARRYSWILVPSIAENIIAWFFGNFVGCCLLSTEEYDMFLSVCWLHFSILVSIVVVVRNPRYWWTQFNI